MAFQEFELNMIPHGDMPSFYASQYETGRPIIIDIMMGEDAFACDELYIELHCRKVDDNIVTLEPDSVDGNQVTFIGTDQLFACPGKNIAELCLYADETKDTSLGSLNFFIEVEPDPLAGGLTSETQIYDLHQQIEEITQEVIGEDYYDKTEVDDLLDLKADKSTTYTKTEVDNALNLKADKSTTYTKSQVDSALALKADASSVYTKGQTDTLLNAKANTSDLATVATTGSYDDLTDKPTIPVAQVQSDWSQVDNTKVDYIKNKPDLSVYATNADVQTAIDNLLPIVSVSGGLVSFNVALERKLKSITVDNSATIVTRCGVNLLNAAVTTIGVNTPTDAVTQALNIKANCVFSMTASNDYANSDNYWLVYLKKKDGTRTYITPTAGQTKTQAITVTADNPIVEIYYRSSGVTAGTVTNFMINYGTTASAYEAYNGTTYSIADIDDITTFNGVNNIFADVGDVSVQAYDTIQHYIDTKVGT